MTEKPTTFLDRGDHLWLGLTLVAVMWPLNWFLPGLRTMYLFFPLWLGYILTVDALVLRRRGTSPLTRATPNGMLMLFCVSAVSWWLFEGVNLVLQNWRYLGREQIGDLSYAVFASVSFSVVMPAVFATAELVRDSAWVERFRDGPRLPPTRRNLVILFSIGVAMLVLSLGLPKIFFPLIWGAIYLILDPINAFMGRESLLDWLRSGDWRPVASLAVGALITGFFWELWNFFSYPKWEYEIPGVDVLHIFEMPLLGYLGYLPFGLELFALFALMRWRPLQLEL